MFDPGTLAVVGGGMAGLDILKGTMATSAAHSAADAQSQAEQRAIDLLQNQYRTLYDPYIQAGQQGITGLNALLADPSKVSQTPEYQFAFGQGEQALQRSLGAQGKLFSGAAGRELTQFGQGLASQQYQMSLQDLLSQIGVGQFGVSGATGIGRDISNLLVGQGTAQAQGITAGSQAQQNMLTQLGNLPGQLYGAYNLNQLMAPPGALASSTGGTMTDSYYNPSMTQYPNPYAYSGGWF